MASSKILKDVTTGTTGHPQVTDSHSPISFQASIAGTGALTATIIIEATNEAQIAASNYLLLGTITLSGTTKDSDGFVATSVPWNVVRARLTAISGTAATVQVYMGMA